MDYLLLAGIILVLYTIYIICDAFKSGWTAPNEATSSDLAAEPENRLIPNKEFTYEELARFNGNDEKKIYISIQNVVFDVTESENFQLGGGYSTLAGKDCSVSLAKLSLDEKYINTYNTAKLSEEEHVNVREWFTKMKRKYPIVGRIRENKKNV